MGDPKILAEPPDAPVVTPYRKIFADDAWS
jgi:hypothetical protein